MTAYLKAGDVIHIATPAMTVEENAKTADQFVKVYALFGITVSMVTQDLDSTQTVVVSVIRKEPA